MAKTRKLVVKSKWLKKIHPQFHGFPLFLLEYFFKKEFNPLKNGKGVAGPFAMYCMDYLYAISKKAGVGEAVKEFSDQLGDRICGIDHYEKNAAYHRKLATKWLEDMLTALQAHAKEPQRCAILTAIREDIIAEINGAYLDEDDIEPE